MDRQHEGETFNYTYSAKQQEEINQIRQKYLPKEETKMDQLRKLDEGATKSGMIVSLAVGIVGMLIFGVGMCCVMVWGGGLFIPGIFIGIVGVLCILAAYPLFTSITRKQREKVAPQILKLTEELSQAK